MSNRWNTRAVTLLRNLNFYRNSLICMRELSLSDHSEELLEKRRETERTVACAERAMAMLTDEERFILDKMIINNGSCPVDDLCEQCICEKSNLYRLRKRALDKFTMAMYGQPDGPLCSGAGQLPPLRRLTSEPSLINPKG